MVIVINLLTLYVLAICDAEMSTTTESEELGNRWACLLGYVIE